MSVFVVQTPKPGPNNFTYDISPALDYGQPIFVFEPHEQPGLAPVPSMFRALDALRDFNDDDHILWAGGDPAGLAIVAAAAAQVNNGRFKFLRWERERDNSTGRRNGRGYYMSVQIDIRGKRGKK